MHSLRSVLLPSCFAFALLACGSNTAAVVPEAVLSGEYDAVGTGAIAAITFTHQNYTLVSNVPCDASACLDFDRGAWALNDAHDSLALASVETGRTTSVSFQALTTAASSTQAIHPLGGGLTTGDGGTPLTVGGSAQLVYNQVSLAGQTLGRRAQTPFVQCMATLYRWESVDCPTTRAILRGAGFSPQGVDVGGCLPGGQCEVVGLPCSGGGDSSECPAGEWCNAGLRVPVCALDTSKATHGGLQCAADAECNGGLEEQGWVCDNNGACSIGCWIDSDCSSGICLQPPGHDRQGTCQ
jgi:hypothetical protein